MARSSPTGLARSIQELLEGDESVECDEPLRCCDGCLALHFAVSLQEATDAALKLATAPGFRRGVNTCGLCKRTLELTSLAPERRPGRRR